LEPYFSPNIADLIRDIGIANGFSNWSQILSSRGKKGYDEMWLRGRTKKPGDPGKTDGTDYYVSWEHEGSRFFSRHKDTARVRTY
jgi:hypothetical protein